MVRAGDIGFGGKRKGFYPKAVRWFTFSRWSHNFVVTPPVFDSISVLEADLKVQIVPFEKEYIRKNVDYWEVWRPTRATESEIYRAVSAAFQAEAGNLYGFAQIVWFAVRQIARRLGIAFGGRNWFPEGSICSETLWQFLVALGGDYKAAFEGLGQNEVSPEDIYRIVKERPDLFTFVMEKT